MRNKRLIFTLLYNDGNFMLSRNFRLQKVGDLNWIENQYNFKNIAFSIDEIIILNVNRHEKDIEKFCNTITKAIKNIFVPIAVGGGISSIDYAKSLFMSGADKIVLNSALTDNPELVLELISEYGSQSIIASIDYIVEDNLVKMFKNNGTAPINFDFGEYIEYIQNLGVGEVYLNSIQQDGTGQGFNIEAIQKYLKLFKIPVIIAGGAGNFSHFVDAAKYDEIDAFATANLFNFIGNSLPNTRNEMIQRNIRLAKFSSIELLNQ